MNKYFLILVLILLVISALLADTYYVDEDYPIETTFNKRSIQTAINSATTTGDEIIIYEADDGYYDEELEIISKNLIIQSAENNDVVIRGQNGITLDISGTISNITIEGLVLQNTDDETVLYVETGCSPNITIQNCVFDDSDWLMIDIEEVSNVYLYDNSFNRSILGSEELVRFSDGSTSSEISGNTFQNTTAGAINIGDTGHVVIHNNEFKDCYGSIYFFNTDNSFSGYIDIYDNLIYDCTYDISGVMTIQGYSIGNVYNNTFVSNASGTPLPNLLDCNSDQHTDINIFENNIMQGFNNFIDCIEDNFPNNIDFNCYDGTIPYPGDHNINSDPEFVDPDNDDYSLKYFSPCIDAGDRDSDYDDGDGSMADMGYAYHEQFIFEWPIIGTPPFSTRSDCKWLSFAKLPVTYPNNNTGQNVSASEVRWHWNNIPDSCAWYYYDGGATPWFYGLDEDSDEYFDYWSSNQNLTSLKGYKIFDEESNTALFTRGEPCQYGYTVSTYQNLDTWIGYFIDETQSAEDAIPSTVLNNCLKIQTQRWCTSRASTGDPWSIDPGTCYLNFSDMVVLKTTRAYNFYWNYSREETEPIIRPYAEHFEWEEEIDYLPIYVEFDPLDVPNEVAVYVNGECQGAEVVENMNCQICAYILTEEPGQEIEFAFWYEGRNGVERKANYQIQENGFPVSSNTLFTGLPGDFYTLSFNHEEESAAIPYSFSCYPNPFNPETTVSFSLKTEAEVELVIYNIRGQKIRTLADETFRPDTYNITWNGDNDNGKKVSSGVYFVKLKIDSEVLTNKVIMLK